MCRSHHLFAPQVVLPAVAKKKGLQDQYETADGSPKPRDEPMVIEPVSLDSDGHPRISVDSGSLRHPAPSDTTPRSTGNGTMQIPSTFPWTSSGINRPRQHRSSRSPRPIPDFPILPIPHSRSNVARNRHRLSRTMPRPTVGYLRRLCSPCSLWRRCSLSGRSSSYRSRRTRVVVVNVSLCDMSVRRKFCSSRFASLNRCTQCTFLSVVHNLLSLLPPWSA